MKRLIVIMITALACGCATAPTHPRITHKCPIVDRIEGDRAVVEAPNGRIYDLPAAIFPGIAEGVPLCALERIADLWEPHELFDCIERGEDVNTCMTEEG